MNPEMRLRLMSATGDVCCRIAGGDLFERIGVAGISVSASRERVAMKPEMRLRLMSATGTVCCCIVDSDRFEELD